MPKPPKRRQAPRIVIKDGHPTTTSRDIAETFGKRHDDVLRRIRALECSPEFRLRNFAEASREVVQPNGGTASYTEYRITRDGFAFLCMGFTGAKAAQWKERYIAHFNRMEATLRDRAARKAASKALPAPATPAPLPKIPLGYGFVHSSALIGDGLPAPRIALPAHIMAAIDARAFDLASEAMPALRDYIVRKVNHEAVNGYGVMPGLAEKCIENTMLRDALAYRHHSELRHIRHLANALHTITGNLQTNIAQALADIPGDDFGRDKRGG